MAEAFLDRLLQTANSVQSDDRNCVICLQETGMMSRETGLIELQLRLPCNHVVGSGCISIWLKENNSCPLCRQMFFPAQHRPYLEHAIVEGREDRDPDGEQEDRDQDDEEGRLEILKNLCEYYCPQLRLDEPISDLATIISHHVSRLVVITPLDLDVPIPFVHPYCKNSIVALGIYITSCISGHPRSPREICGVRDVDGDLIREAYDIHGDFIRELYSAIYGRREELINDAILQLLEDPAILVWPLSGHEMSDDQIQSSRDVLAMKKLCAKYCDRLRVSFPLDELSQHIAANLIHTGFELLSYPATSRYVSQSEVAAVSLYIASHLAGQPVSRRAIQSLMGAEYADIRSTYRVVRDVCDQLVGESFREDLGVHLSWETLETDVREESDDGRDGDHEDDDAMEEDESNDGERATDTGDAAVSAVTSRIQEVQGLCNDYCNRLSLTDDRIKILALGLAERFTPLMIAPHCCPESIAATCTYIACWYWGQETTYEGLEAVADVSADAILGSTDHLLSNTLVEGGVSLDGIIESLVVSDPRMR